jgi:hypothetical protein
MDPLERIAQALERIANAMEAQTYGQDEDPEPVGHEGLDG